MIFHFWESKVFVNVSLSFGKAFRSKNKLHFYFTSQFLEYILLKLFSDG